MGVDKYKRQAERQLASETEFAADLELLETFDI